MTWCKEKEEAKSNKCKTYFDRMPRWLEKLIESDESLAHLKRKKYEPPYMKLQKRKGRRNAHRSQSRNQTTGRSDHNGSPNRRSNRRNTGAGPNGQSERPDQSRQASNQRNVDRISQRQD